MNAPIVSLSLSALRASYAQLTADGPVRAREAAARLGITEAELVAAELGLTSQALRPDWTALLTGLQDVGEVLAITRNDHVVHEKSGVYKAVSVQGPMGLVVGKEIDLRLFLSGWRYLFEVSEPGKGDKPRRSLQCFDRHGLAMHKVYATDKTDLVAWQKLVDELADLGAGPQLAVEPPPAPTVELADSDIDVLALRTEWQGLRDTHDFFGMLRRHKVGRLQALRLVGGELAEQLPLDAWQHVVEQARDQGVSIMVFAGNRGAIQIHTGPVERIVRTGPWWNVLDAGFDWHVRSAAIASVWRVRKPTADGVVTSIEVFDSDGEWLFWLFGERKPGIPESPAWRALADGLAAGG